ncbi:hypothetical protein GTA08_BOTSDO08541 [Botryosphaeria dothidea]|uniref:Uncharacterized protein n=1 Tax=Botryosphaeria dothidea TaxID=55169 RepID=A0A8H4IPT6_9PEZI|nr:hypothetical protein GTA08_BOTSDO08541 [Botryosphaeria dothidea]
MFDLGLMVVGLLGYSILAKASNCYPPLYHYEAGHIPSPDSNLKVCNVLPYYNPHLSCCPQESTCLDNGLCLTPSNSSLGFLQYAGCTYLSGYGQACPGAEYCAYKSVPDGPYQRGSWNVIPCSNGKYCCSFGEISNECCADEEETFEVSWGPVPDHSTTIYSTWTYTTTATTTESVCPTASSTLAGTTPVNSVATPTIEARFTA